MTLFLLFLVVWALSAEYRLHLLNHNMDQFQAWSVQHAKHHINKEC